MGMEERIVLAPTWPHGIHSIYGESVGGAPLRAWEKRTGKGGGLGYLLYIFRSWEKEVPKFVSSCD